MQKKCQHTSHIPNSPVVPVWDSPYGPEKAPVGYRTRQNNVHWVPSCLRTIKSPKGTVTQPNSRQQTNAEVFQTQRPARNNE